MTMRILICAAVSAVLLSAPLVDASAFGPGPNLWGDLEFKPVVGHWAEYQMTPEGEKPMTMRVSIVGQEDDDYWYETIMTTDKGEKVITKMLVSGDPKSKENTKRMIIKSGDEPAMEMPVQMMQMMGGMDEPEPEDELEDEAPETEMVDLGVESVEVPAGTFDAHHWQLTSEDMVFDAWISSEVGPYGVVRSAADEFEMILLSHGDDAVSLITETPQSLPMKGFPMPGKGGE
jgi:hypothetical protein